MVDANVAARGDNTRTARVSDPFGRSVDARFGLLATGSVAMVDTAEACPRCRVGIADHQRHR
jgi:glycerate kinase